MAKKKLNLKGLDTSGVPASVKKLADPNTGVAWSRSGATASRNAATVGEAKDLIAPVIRGVADSSPAPATTTPAERRLSLKFRFGDTEYDLGNLLGNRPPRSTTPSPNPNRLTLPDVETIMARLGGTSGGGGGASSAAAKARASSNPIEKQALLVKRAKQVGDIGTKAKRTMKSLSSAVKGGTATAEQTAQYNAIKQRRQAAKSSTTKAAPVVRVNLDTPTVKRAKRRKK